MSRLLDMWVEEELKPGSLSNGTVTTYMDTIRTMKHHPIYKRKLKNITPEHLQTFIDGLCFGRTDSGGKVHEPLSLGCVTIYRAILNHVFRYAVYPKKLISFNPMQYVRKKKTKKNIGIFAEGDNREDAPTITHKQYMVLMEAL